VGTLHEINSETSTVALENVSSFGTEGRKSDPSEEIIPPSDSVYEYIVFRGSDVKDLRVEEPPAARENIPPQVPNDPAILGVSVDISRICFSASCPAMPYAFYVMKYFGC
jgi:protein LSM14